MNIGQENENADCGISCMNQFFGKPNNNRNALTNPNPPEDNDYDSDSDSGQHGKIHRTKKAKWRCKCCIL